jgi:hypothetical protein
MGRRSGKFHQQGKISRTGTGAQAGTGNRVKPHTRVPAARILLGMPLLNVVVTLIIVGVILWLINTYIPMQSTIKKILNVVVVIVVILWLLYGFGVISNSGDIHLPVVK